MKIIIFYYIIVTFIINVNIKVNMTFINSEKESK